MPKIIMFILIYSYSFQIIVLLEYKQQMFLLPIMYLTERKGFRGG